VLVAHLKHGSSLLDGKIDHDEAVDSGLLAVERELRIKSN